MGNKHSFHKIFSLLQEFILFYRILCYLLTLIKLYLLHLKKEGGNNLAPTRICPFLLKKSQIKSF